MKDITYCLDTLSDLIVQISPLITHKPIITFTGFLGAGKTTIIRQLLHTWGILEGVTSPTFTYMNQYTTSAGLKIFHFDLYRLSDQSQFFELGFDEYFDQEHAVVLVEWPHVIESFLKNKEVSRISLIHDHTKPDIRRIIIE